MANKRIYYAIQQVGLAPAGTTGAGSFTQTHTIKGLQSVGINTRFNLEQVFEIGQLQIYQNIENIPDVEITLEKCLDGHPLIYHLATRGAVSGTLAGRSNIKASLVLSIFDDTQDMASGTPITEVYCSGVFVSSLNYNFAVDGNFSESVTVVGNNKVWRSSSFFFTGQFDGTGSETAPLATEGVNRRQHFLFGTGVLASKLPTGTSGGGIPGIDGSGYNVKTADEYGAHVQSVRVQANLGREQLNELGRKGPYHRYVSFPVEVRCDIEVLSISGDQIAATEDGTLGNGNNLSDKTIYISVQEGTILDLGTRNKLASVNYGNANAGGRGGNATVTYSYTTFNDLTVKHPQDPSGLYP